MAKISVLDRYRAEEICRLFSQMSLETKSDVIRILNKQHLNNNWDGNIMEEEL